jgi:hypothetical protein
VEAFYVGLLIVAAFGVAWLAGLSAYKLYRGQP